MVGLIELLSGPVWEAAPRLLGATLRWRQESLLLTEVEAYDGESDPGSHAYRGPTDRNRVMFGPPGHLYVYLSYGLHHCANISCGPEGKAAGVLMRAGVLGDGRFVTGPGRLGRALELTRGDNGHDLSSQITLATEEVSFSTGPRVGLRHGAQRPWRFWITGHPSVSRYVPAKPTSTGASPSSKS